MHLNTPLPVPVLIPLLPHLESSLYLYTDTKKTYIYIYIYIYIYMKSYVYIYMNTTASFQGQL